MAAAPALAAASEMPRMALAPMLVLLSVPSFLSMSCRKQKTSRGGTEQESAKNVKMTCHKQKSGVARPNKNNMPVKVLMFYLVPGIVCLHPADETATIKCETSLTPMQHQNTHLAIKQTQALLCAQGLIKGRQKTKKKLTENRVHNQKSPENASKLRKLLEIPAIPGTKATHPREVTFRRSLLAGIGGSASSFDGNTEGCCVGKPWHSRARPWEVEWRSGEPVFRCAYC